MAIKISQLITDAVDLALKFGEEELNIKYTPSKMTPAALAELADIEKLPAGEQLEAIVRLGENLLTGWDLTDEDGNPVPVTAKGLRGVPMGIINRVVYEIINHMQLGEVNGATSVAN